MEKEICHKFCVWEGISCAESVKMLQAYSDSVLSKTQACEWYKPFKDCHQIINDLPRSGRPSTSTTD